VHVRLLTGLRLLIYHSINRVLGRSQHVAKYKTIPSQNGGGCRDRFS
jgi:hypothetical protein